nr:hypothetical protein CFP56_53901 [Quercus suber]
MTIKQNPKRNPKKKKQNCFRPRGLSLSRRERKFQASLGKRLGGLNRAFFVGLNKVICRLQENKQMRIALLWWNAFGKKVPNFTRKKAGRSE